MVTIRAEALLDLEDNQTSLGIEFGSTRIKAVLIDSHFETLASGSYEWENSLTDGIWTYSLEEVWRGLQESYRQLAAEVFEKYGQVLTSVGAIGVSAMMHGYMAFDGEDKLLVPFRTWRNSTTAAASSDLTALFDYNIPQRWSVAHLYQALLDDEPHVTKLRFLTTLAGYVHWQLTGEQVLGVGDASGMFPIDSATGDYDAKMLAQFDDLTAVKKAGIKLSVLLPKVLTAGQAAGALTKNGAYLLDPSGHLQAGIPLCPPEGDAGTGMIATNSVKVRTGNISVGTSAFAMIVLDRPVKLHPEIDCVTTPSGEPVAMVHENNCSSDLNAWVGIFGDFVKALGLDVTASRLYQVLFDEAMKAAPDVSGLVSYGYLSGENITGLDEGRPVFARQPESDFSLANVMRTHLYSAFAAMRIGMDILRDEGVTLDSLVAQGGLFKTPKVAQKMLSAAMAAPITVMTTAGEGGAWGSAILAAYARDATSQSLADYLSRQVFVEAEGVTLAPEQADLDGYDSYMRRYRDALAIEKTAVAAMRKEG